MPPPRSADVYHEGELRAQQLAGERNRALQTGQVISNAILPAALPFLEQLPLAAAASLDENGNPWASLLLGLPGFLRSPDGVRVTCDLDRMYFDAGDHFRDNVEENSQAGLLAIDLATRRRLRINGRMRRESPSKWVLDVEEAYPNCPKYIQRRHLLRVGQRDAPAAARLEGRALQEPYLELIRRADTFFVASAHPQRGLDASHRGGRPGFVQAVNEQNLRIPDYPGNSMFNTIGNFLAYPRAGLLFPDFAHSRVLQLTGAVNVQWDSASERETGGTGRYWEFTVERWTASELPAQMEWEFLDYSAYNPG